MFQRTLEQFLSSFSDAATESVSVQAHGKANDENFDDYTFKDANAHL